MEFVEYYKSLTPPQREAYAKKAGTTANYIRVHIIAPDYRRKIPRLELMRGLAKASKKNVTLPELVSYFY